METKKLKLSNADWVNVLKGLYAVQELPGLKFALLVAKNTRILKEELNDLEEVAKPEEKFQALSQEVAKLDNDPDREEKLKKIEKENKSLIDQRNKQMAELKKLMDVEVEIEMYTITEDLLSEQITASQLNGIFPILE